MEGFLKKTSGAVSIFLVIILVPMLTVSALFVDAGKLYLGEAVATSAGELALNTALTEYDTDLKNLYGLFATAQDTDELYDSLEDYYRTCIISSGVSEEDTGSYVDLIMQQLQMTTSDNSASDILNMEVLEFDVSKRDDATLANASVLKKQIVDFMKYRGPINTGLGFLSSLKSFSTLSKQTELVEKRTEYYEAENDVMKLLKSAWDNINKYNDTNLIKDENYFTGVKNSFNNLEETFRGDIHSKTIKDLYDTNDYVNYTFQITEENFNYTKPNGVNTTEQEWRITFALGSGAIPEPQRTFVDYLKGYSSLNPPTAEDITTKMSSFYSYLNAMKAYREELFRETDPGDTYELQYLVQTMRKGEFTAYASKGLSVYTSYQQLKAAMLALDYHGVNAGTSVVSAASVNNTEVTVNNNTKKISEHFSDITAEYEHVMNPYGVFIGMNNVFTDISQEIQKNNTTDSTAVNQKLEDTSEKLSSYVKEMEEAAGYLEEAARLIGEAKTSVESGTLKTAKDNWTTSANDADLKNTSMAKQDIAEIDQLGKYLNVQDMDKMITRLTNIAENLRKVVEEIKKYKYEGTFIGDINGFGKLESVLEGKIGASALKSVPLSTEQLNITVANWFEWEAGAVDVSWINNSGTQVKLHGQGTDKLNFYSYLYTHFNTGPVSASTDKKTEDKDNGENLYDNIKSTSNTAASKEAEGSDTGNVANKNEISSKPNLPSKQVNTSGSTASGTVSTGDNAVSDTKDNLNSMFSGLSSKLINMGAELRDNLYVTDYAMSMFSYDTIEKEYEKNGKSVSDIATLTLVPMNATNNFAYGKEVEYIIYGGTNSSNLTKAYGSIYGIRLGFNLIYAFMDSEIRDGAFAIATPISAATLGVIPVPLIQAAIIIGIACCESGLDLMDLKNGEKVPLFKNQNTWRMSFSGLVNVAKGVAGEVTKKAVDYALEESSKKLTEYLDMTNDELNENIDEKSMELKKFMSDAYDTMITRHADMAIQKLTTLATNAIEEQRKNAELNMTQYVIDGLDNWLAEEAQAVDTSSDLAYIAKKAAVDVIKSYYIDEIISLIQTAQNSAEDKMEEVILMLQAKLSNIKNAINDEIGMSCDEIKKYKDDMLKEVNESILNGADALKETVNSKLDGIFGDTSIGEMGGSTDNTGISSLLSFAYSDYLRLFLMIGLYTNEEGIMLRIADVIQVNMAMKSGNDKYMLSNSAAYVELNAEVQVKPTLLALPLFSDVAKNPVTRSNWYTVNYKSISGY